MLHRFIKWDAVDGIRLFTGANIGNQLIKRVVHAIVGADDVYLTAPHQQCHGGFKQFAELVVEGGFVNNHAALFTAQVGGTAGQCGDAPAGSKADNEGQNGLFVIALNKHFLCFGDFTRSEVVKLCPVGTVADKFQCHVFVVADIPGIHAATGCGQQGGVGGLAPA